VDVCSDTVALSRVNADAAGNPRAKSDADAESNANAEGNADACAHADADEITLNANPRTQVNQYIKKQALSNR